MTRTELRILFVTPECAPLVKTGGLGDVAGSLPGALSKLHLDVRILLPAYRDVLRSVDGARELARYAETAAFPACRLLDGGRVDGAPLLLLDCPSLFDRDGGPYQDAADRDWPDNAKRFGLLCRVAADLAHGGLERGADGTIAGGSRLDWLPDVVHCNDWQTGLVPAYLRFGPRTQARTVLTVHNLAFQGIFPPATVERLGLPAESFSLDGLEYFGNMSFLKAGLQYADAITTVSPTYAAQIQVEPLGMGMHGLLAERRDALTGILNGIDTHTWNPGSDARIPHRFSEHDLSGKQTNKRSLQRLLGLSEEVGVPLFASVSRLTLQKGIDLILDVAAELLALPAQLVVLGSGDRALQSRLEELAQRHPGRVGVRVGFDEGLAHLIEAGADMFLMPSRFEPCGMNQMYSQRYGTVPIVHATGGLADSVTDCTEETLAAGTATGLVFSPCTSDEMLRAIQRAQQLYGAPATWRAIQAAGMRRDFSWTASATRYAGIYRRLAESRAPSA
jgi:starch synthase